MPLTEEQLLARRNGLGGSDALAYCGKDPRCTPLQLYMQKIGESNDDYQMDMRQEFGHRLEPVMREWLSEKLGKPIVIPDITYVSTQYPFLIGNLDGIVECEDGYSANEIVEIKTADKFMAQEFGEVGTDQVPLRYLLQVMHYMIVTGMRRAHLAVLIGGNDARHYVIDYDEQLAQMLIEYATKFWEKVVNREPPLVITIEDANIRWKAIEGKIVEANNEMVNEIENYKSLKIGRRFLDKKICESELILKSYMQDAVILQKEKNTLLTWQEQTRRFIDKKRLEFIAPDVLKAVEKQSKYRVLRIKGDINE